MDLEGTLVHGSAIRPFVVEGRKLGIFSRDGLVQAQVVGILSQVIPPARGTLRFLAMRRLVAGLPVAEVQRAGERWIDILMDNLKTPVYERLNAYTAAGIPVYILSGALHDGVVALAQRLGVAGGEGSKVGQQAGVYTAEAASPLCQAEEKAGRARRLAERHGVDLSECAAYPDAAVDLPMLRLVGRPVAVDPDTKLRAVAVSEGWEIVETKI